MFFKIEKINLFLFFLRVSEKQIIKTLKVFFFKCIYNQDNYLNYDGPLWFRVLRDERERKCVCVCERERKCVRERGTVCSERERERDRKCVCVCEREREREREIKCVVRERKCVCVCERERKCVCVWKERENVAVDDVKERLVKLMGPFPLVVSIHLSWGQLSHQHHSTASASTATCFCLEHLSHTHTHTHAITHSFYLSFAPFW